MKSDNHASPNGILPFVVPAGPRTMTTSDVPISSGGLKKWADGQDASAAKVTVGCGIGGGGVGGGGGGGGDSLVDARHDAYMTLITLHIRRAWVCCCRSLNQPVITMASLSSSSSSHLS